MQVMRRGCSRKRAQNASEVEAPRALQESEIQAWICAYEYCDFGGDVMDEMRIVGGLIALAIAILVWMWFYLLTRD